MPSVRATRRASSTAPSEQQPACLGSVWLSCQICMVRPMTSKPRRTRRAAATLLSTPPDMATRTGPLRLPAKILDIRRPLQGVEDLGRAESRSLGGGGHEHEGGGGLNADQVRAVLIVGDPLVDRVIAVGKMLL